ncbi:glycosyltransferase BC10 isoform X2 [Henckelia pumila]|uniref:glycosyltransferase BC10 isoform X2 n=1 Tax=Henckelia pumila TaxID=405737 RepID=UPI003C6DE314
MEEEAFGDAFVFFFFRHFSTHGIAVQPHSNVFSAYNCQAQNRLPIYSKESDSTRHGLGCFFSVFSSIYNSANHGYADNQDLLQGDGENRFSIYVHSRPGFLLNKATTRSPYFLNRQINDSIQVDWGEASMIQAERILLQNALMHPLNERFIFLSDSCIPLYNFSYVYDYMMSTSTSFVDSFADTKEGRYNPKMDPVIPVDNWRKGSQWVVLTRKHAEIVVQDDSVFPMFQWHCKKRSLPEFWRELALPADASKEHNCIPDEHYVQTLFAKGLEGEITRRSLTHSSWDLSSSKDPERRGWHPLTYKLADASPMLIQSIKGIDNIYYETEYRREWCTSKGKPSKCFLFARKFTRPAALRLLNNSVLGISNEAPSRA